MAASIHDQGVLVLREDDPSLASLDFRPYRSAAARHACQFLPGPDEPQILSVRCPWGETLTAEPGDYVVSESELAGSEEDRWVVSRCIFERTYAPISEDDDDTRRKLGSGRGKEGEERLFRKEAMTHLVPMIAACGGDPESRAILCTREGEVTVRAGDFHLARGADGEIWPIPNEKVGRELVVVYTD